jgi:hypothetical protein
VIERVRSVIDSSYPPLRLGSDSSVSRSATVARIRPGSWKLVALIGGASLVLYGLLLTVTPDLVTAQPSYAVEVFPWITPLNWRYVRGPHAAAAIRFLLLLLGLFILYALALRSVAGQQSRALETTVFGLGAGFLALQTVGPAMLSTDIFAYTTYGRIFGLYHDDPYAKGPWQFPADPYARLTYYLDVPSWYGPLWTLLSAVLAWLGGERIGLTVLLFRGLVIGAALAAGALIWASLRLIAPQRAAQGLLFFLWNPLVVLETGLSGHNDAVMVALLLLGIWLHLRDRRVLAVAALALSPLVKFITGLVLPLYVLMLLRQLPTWRERIRFLAVSAATVGLVLAAVLGLARGGLPDAGQASAARFYENSVSELVFAALIPALGREQANIWLRLVTLLVIGSFWLVAAWHATDLRSLLAWSAGLMLVACWFVIAETWPWYVIWALALGAFLPGSPPALLAALFSATVLSMHASLGYKGHSDSWVYVYRSLPAYVLPLALFTLGYLARRVLRAARRA